MNSKTLASYLDATNLKLDASDAEICALCDEAAHAGYASVCIYPSSISICANILYATPVKVCTVIGFPHGRASVPSMAAEILEAKEQGAGEVDIVMNYSALRAGERNYVAEQIQSLCETARSADLLTKIIVETCYLNETQKLHALKICEAVSADFIKTSTGFGSGGATVGDVTLFRDNRINGIKIKASGGIRTLADAQAMIDAGAQRLGVSAAGSILGELQGKSSSADSNSSY